MGYLEQTLDWLRSPQAFWGLLWAGLTALSITLLVLVRTRWGRTKPLRKCALLSVFAHLLFAVYASSVQFFVASAGSPQSRETTVRVSDFLIEEPGQESSDSPDASQLADTASSDTPSQPWESFGLTETLASPPIEPDEPTPNEAPTAQRSEPTVVEEPPSEFPLPEPDPVAAVSDTPSAASLAADLPQPTTVATVPESPPVESPMPQRQEAPITPSPEVADPAPAAPDQAAELPFSADALVQPGATEPGVAANDVATDVSATISELIRESSDVPAPRAAAADIPPGEPSFGALQPLALPEGADTVSTTPSSFALDSPPGALERTSPAPPEATAVPQPLEERVAPDRMRRAQQFGGTAQTESAVTEALAWLARNQSPDGRWDAQKHGGGRSTTNPDGHDRGRAGSRADTGMTGLALLAFLGAGHSHVRGDFQDTVRKGLEFLMRSQRPDGSLGGQAEPYAFMYCHGMAGIALSEAFALSADPRLEHAVRKAVAYTLAVQHPVTGGWRYQPGDLGDTSQLGWQVMLLKSAELAGLKVPRAAIDGAIRYLQSVSSGTHRGLASYRPRERVSRPMTAEALVCRQFLGLTRENPASDEAGDFLIAEPPGGKTRNFYYWYYATLGMFQLQGSHWERWNMSLQAALLPTQRSDGDAAGSWDPNDTWGGYGGRVYSTAMGALCLEVYYRFLPLYGIAQRGQPPASPSR